LNIILRLLSAAITGNSKYLSSDYGNEGTDEWIAAHPHRRPIVMNNPDCTQTVYNANSRTVTEHLTGTTLEGNRNAVATRIGRRTWKVSDEQWDLESAEQKKRRADMERR
jgi:hypothetical protein